MSGSDTFMIRARRCIRCGRLLTGRDAVERGYGCVCAEKARMEGIREQQEREPLPGQMTMEEYLASEELEENEKED